MYVYPETRVVTEVGFCHTFLRFGTMARGDWTTLGMERSRDLWGLKSGERHSWIHPLT